MQYYTVNIGSWLQKKSTEYARTMIVIARVHFQHIDKMHQLKTYSKR